MTSFSTSTLSLSVLEREGVGVGVGVGLYGGGIGVPETAPGTGGDTRMESDRGPGSLRCRGPPVRRDSAFGRDGGHGPFPRDWRERFRLEPSPLLSTTV